MKISELIEVAEIGDIIRFSNGKPKPPAHHTRKLRTWETENSYGTLEQILPGEYGSITLRQHQNDIFGPSGRPIVQFSRGISLTSDSDFEIVPVEEIGTLTGEAS